MTSNENNALPSTYKEGVARVSSIVESQFPFEGEAKRRFEDWIRKKDVLLEDYMKEASEGGTAVHNALEAFANGEPATIQPRWSSFVSAGMKWHRENNVKTVSTETYVIDKEERFQGTIDLVAKIGRKTYICDYKTYGLAKHAFGLHNEEAKRKKPSEKLKKARLQLSLYAYATGIKNIAVVELTRQGYYFHPLKLVPKKELETIIVNFLKQGTLMKYTQT